MNMVILQKCDAHSFLKEMHDYFKGDYSEFKKHCEQLENGKRPHPEPTRSAMTESPISLEVETTRSPTIIPTPEVDKVPKRERTYNLSIPMTLAALSIVDVVGFLKGTESNPNKTENNFVSFFNTHIDKDKAIVLNRLFRQGLSHSFFAKCDLGIGYHSKNPVGLLFFKDSISYSLNVNYLLEKVIEIFECVVEESITSETILNQYKILYELNRKDFIENIKRIE